MSLGKLQFTGVLVLIALALVFFWFYTVSAWDRSELWLNLGTELVGILLVVLLIDGIVRLREQRDLRRLRRIALLQLRRACHPHLDTLVQMYKAASEKRPPTTYHHVRDLLERDFAIAIQDLDFSSPAPVVPKRDWFTYLEQAFRAFDKRVDRIIGLYGAHLDPDWVDMLQNMLDSRLSWFIYLAPSMKKVDNEHGISRTYDVLKGASDLSNDHAKKFLALVELHNSESNTADAIVLKGSDWRNDIAPRFGSSRIQKTAVVLPDQAEGEP